METVHRQDHSETTSHNPARIGVRLVLFAAGQAPCVRNPDQPGRTLCDRPTAGGAAITEVQALVWCGNGRCHRCDPDWQGRVGQTRRAAAW